jgi:hypothetical protein
MLRLASVLAVLALAAGCGDGKSNEERNFHAGFVDGCSKRQPAKYCECLYDKLDAEPGSDTLAEKQAMQKDLEAGGAVPPELQRAVNACAPSSGP